VIEIGSWLMLSGCFLALFLFGLLRTCFIVVHVVGTSMYPSLHPGDRVLVRRGVRLRVGAVVVLCPPFDMSARASLLPAAAARLRGRRWLIKRISAVAGDRVPDEVRDATHGAMVVPDGALVVLSDNPAGTDSRSWGFIAVSDVLGRVVLKLPGGLHADQDAGAD
jgi:signal peptidase I